MPRKSTFDFISAQRRKWEAERQQRRTIVMSISTHVPSKYRLVDLETGNVWKIDAAAPNEPLRGPTWKAADDLIFQIDRKTFKP